MIGVATQRSTMEVFVDADLDTLTIALYARFDDLLKDRPELVPWRPKIGIAPKLADAELITLAVLQVLQGFNEEARWLRHADIHLRHLFPYLPGQAGYNKRLRKSAVQLQVLIRVLAQDTDAWADDTWLIDSTPVETARSRPTVQRSNLAGWAGYGYCASHSRFFYGLRLHLVCTPAGLPVTFALTNPKADERDVAIDMFDHDPTLLVAVAADLGRSGRWDGGYGAGAGWLPGDGSFMVVGGGVVGDAVEESGEDEAVEGCDGVPVDATEEPAWAEAGCLHEACSCAVGFQ